MVAVLEAVVDQSVQAFESLLLGNAVVDDVIIFEFVTRFLEAESDEVKAELLYLLKLLRSDVAFKIGDMATFIQTHWFQES